MDKTDICAICIEDIPIEYHDFKYTDPFLIKLTCGHIFHIDCIYNYMVHQYNSQYIEKTFLYNDLSKYKCSLCRKKIHRKLLVYVSKINYTRSKETFDDVKYKLKSLKKQHNLFYWKAHLKRIFIKMSRKDIYNYINKNETYIEEIDEYIDLHALKKKELESAHYMYYSFSFNLTF